MSRIARRIPDLGLVLPAEPGLPEGMAALPMGLRVEIEGEGLIAP